MNLKLHHINYSTKNVEALSKFYREVFSLKSIDDHQHNQVTSHGYNQSVDFLTDGTTEFHLATQDLGVAFRTGHSINPLERGHIAFRTDNIDAFKTMLKEKGIPFADYGLWAMEGWYQIFLQDPDGTIVEVHEINYKARS